MPEETTTWRCTVCGYIHRGPSPPDVCPVCGAPQDAFEPYEEPAGRPARMRVSKWRCLTCGYVHSGGEPPEECPVCGAHGERFEPLGGETEGIRKADRSRKVVIVGAGIAGLAAAESLREASPEIDITLVGREQHLPYYRLNLTRYLGGRIDRDDLPIHAESWYEDRKIHLLLGVEARAIDLDARTLTCTSGETLPYHKLLLVAGADPYVPQLAGANRKGVFTIRTIDDANRIIEACTPGARCICIGGGVLGLETAAALAGRGGQVTLLENHAWPMPRQLNQAAGEVLAEHVRGLGVELRADALTAEILGDSKARGVRLEDGAELPADLVVIATGIRPNNSLARQAGLEVNRGVVVDNHLTTSHPDVLAAGDVAEHDGVTYGLWEPAQFQGNIAGMNLAGVAAEFGGLARATRLKVVGLDLVSIGRFQLEGPRDRQIEERREGHYHLFLVRDGRLAGAILAGDTRAAAVIQNAVDDGADLSELLQKGATAANVVDFLTEG